MKEQDTSHDGSGGEPAAGAAEKIRQDSHREALATLLYSIAQSEGWALVVGRAGSGKTRLLEELKAALRPEVTCVHLNAGQCPTPLGLFGCISNALEMEGPCQYKARFLLDFRELIQHYRLQGRKILILVDRAEKWGPEMLREIELLGNEDQFSPRVLNIFLLARPEFLQTLEAMGATNLKHNLRRFRRLASPSDARPHLGERRNGPRAHRGIDYFHDQAAQEMHLLSGAALEARRKQAQTKQRHEPAVSPEPAGRPPAKAAGEPAAKRPDSPEEINALLDLVLGPVPPKT